MSDIGAIGFGIDFDASEVLADVRRMRRAIEGEAVRKVAGRGVANELRSHFTALDASRPNRLGGKRTHFWARARRGVQQPELDGGNGALISINAVGVAAQFFGTGGLPGGAIVPLHGRYLTIPAVPEAYGKRAGEFPGLKFAFARDPRDGKMKPALVIPVDAGPTAGIRSARRATRSGTRRQVLTLREGIKTVTEPRVIFWLVRKVRFEGDPTVLPSDQQLEAAAVAAVQDYIDVL